MSKRRRLAIASPGFALGQGFVALLLATTQGCARTPEAPERQSVETIVREVLTAHYFTAPSASGYLRRVGHPVVPELVKALRDERPAVRGRAARVLGQFGPDAEGAVQPLAWLLRRESSGSSYLEDPVWSKTCVRWVSVEEAAELTKIDRWFIQNIQEIIEIAGRVAEHQGTDGLDEMPDEL